MDILVIYMNDETFKQVTILFYLNEFYSLFSPCWKKSCWIHSVFPTTNFIWWYLLIPWVRTAMCSLLSSCCSFFLARFYWYPFWFVSCGKTFPFFNIFSKMFSLSVSFSLPFSKIFKTCCVLFVTTEWLAHPTVLLMRQHHWSI